MIIDVIHVIGGILSVVGVSLVLMNNKLVDKNVFNQLFKILCFEWIFLHFYAIVYDTAFLVYSLDCTNRLSDSCTTYVLVARAGLYSLYGFLNIMTFVLAYIPWCLVGENGSMDKFNAKTILVLSIIGASTSLLDPIQFVIAQVLWFLGSVMAYVILPLASAVSSFRTWLRLRKETKSRQNKQGRTSLTIINTKNYNTSIPIAKVAYILSGIAGILVIVSAIHIILFGALQADQLPEIPSFLVVLKDLYYTIQRFSGFIFAIGIHLMFKDIDLNSTDKNVSLNQVEGNAGSQTDTNFSQDITISMNGSTEGGSGGLNSVSLTDSTAPLNPK
ncbi:hypothetical protein BC833DRAFT_608426 [Globomyces pollinis-pini]|nr:hypothetical protein BC833DRAFT_608426 [Globomyces pollinis-pini]KAJ2993186.1 hypothetical protein HDV02_002594 [Globomyces sp. JEL0801]